VIEARSQCRRAIGCGDGAKPQHVQLVEQQFHVRRHVVGDENQRSIRGRKIVVHGSITGER